MLFGFRLSNSQETHAVVMMMSGIGGMPVLSYCGT